MMRIVVLVLAASLALPAAAGPAKKKKPVASPPPELDIPLVPLVPAKPKEPTRLTIRATVPGARVFVDEKPVGDTPLAPIQGLPAGKHVVRLSKPGYVEWRADVELVAGGTVTLTPELLASVGMLTVRSAVAGATAYVDGEIAGPLPLVNHEVAPGPHVLEVRVPGRPAAMERFTARAGVTTTIEARLPAGSLAAAATDTATRTVTAVQADAATHTEATTTVEAAPLTSQWWFWVAAGAVVVAAIGTTAAVVATSQPTPYKVIPEDEACGVGVACDAVIRGIWRP